MQSRSLTTWHYMLHAFFHKFHGTGENQDYLYKDFWLHTLQTKPASRSFPLAWIAWNLPFFRFLFFSPSCCFSCLFLIAFSHAIVWFPIFSRCSLSVLFPLAPFSSALCLFFISFLFLYGISAFQTACALSCQSFLSNIKSPVHASSISLNTHELFPSKRSLEVSNIFW